MQIVISSKPGQGKTAVAQIISTALRQAGMNVTVVDDDGDFANVRRPSDVAGKDVTITMVQIARESIGG
jgi:CO dehydrogenase nickel-insertion accessory protein CooC1